MARHKAAAKAEEPKGKTLKAGKTIRLEPVAPATEIRVDGPGDTDFVVRANMGTLIHFYGSEDQHLGGGQDWTFTEPGEYTLRHMNSAGVEFKTETITVE